MGNGALAWSQLRPDNSAVQALGPASGNPGAAARTR